MPREEDEKMTREEAGRKGGEARKGSEKHFILESQERIKEDAKKAGEERDGRSKQRNNNDKSSDRMSEGGRKGGEK